MTEPGGSRRKERTMTKFEKLQHYLLSLPLGSGEERQRKADLFGAILTKAGFTCINNSQIICDPEMDCRDCLAEGNHET